MMKNLKRNWLVVSKLTWGIWQILTRALENLKHLHFNGLLLNKVYNVWAKKSIGEFSLMALNTDATFEGKLTCAFKNDMRNLANFHQNTWKCQNWYFHGILLFKVENAWATNYMSYRGVISNDTEEWWKIWREIDLSFQNWHKEFDEFWPQNSKVSKIYTFMGCFWPNYIMFELKKYRGVMFNCTQDWYKIWRKTDLCFQKCTWGIWQIFTRALESLQIGTLMASSCLKLKGYELKI